MRISTANFGKIKIKDDKIINFKKKILGFENYSKFTIINNIDDNLFYWLQSTIEPSLSFILVNPLDFIEEYKIDLTVDFQKSLQIEKDDDLAVYSLVNIPEDNSYIAINLKAPVIINADKMLAGQVVLNEDYPVRHVIYQRQNSN